MTYPTDDATVRRLLLHEAAVHAVPGRRLSDLGDAILLLDPVDPEPFWNRLAGVRWPSEPDAFDRRLTEVAVQFAAAARQPHVWLTPPHDRPADLAQRLIANGFRDTGAGLLLVTADGTAARASLRRGSDADVRLERHTRLAGPAARNAAGAIVDVLVDAFGVEPERRAGILGETLASLGDGRFTHYLARIDGVPAAVARAATFDGATYLSSIGTATRARGRGLGRLVTATATVAGLDAGSEWVHLGVFVDNQPARGLYERLGFQLSGEPGPDMLLVG